ncbi:MAG TPA: AEC family transporter [Candidatus Avisuccinivibrio pullicola]|nr:AEC family transporter [Candidatus Avisuccinivibrio pullicola]
MSFLDTFLQVMVLFCVVIVGFAASKAGLMNADFSRQLSALVIKVCSPMLILASAMGDVLPPSEAIVPVLLYGTLSLVLLILLALPLTRLLRLKDFEAGCFKFMFGFGNVAFIGFPVVASLFGIEAVFYAALLTLPFNLLIFTVGYMFILGTEGMHVKFKLFVSPLMLATYGALIIVVAQLSVPAPVASAAQLVGQMTVPASLLIIGSSLADLPVQKMLGTPKLYAMCALKLVLMPAAVYGVLYLCPVEREYADVIVILSAMPVAAYGVMFCAQHGLDTALISEGIFLSTFFSLFSVPLVASLL